MKRYLDGNGNMTAALEALLKLMKRVKEEKHGAD